MTKCTSLLSPLVYNFANKSWHLRTTTNYIMLIKCISSLIYVYKKPQTISIHVQTNALLFWWHFESLLHPPLTAERKHGNRERRVTVFHFQPFLVHLALGCLSLFSISALSQPVLSFCQRRVHHGTELKMRIVWKIKFLLARTVDTGQNGDTRQKYYRHQREKYDWKFLGIKQKKFFADGCCWFFEIWTLFWTYRRAQSTF